MDEIFKIVLGKNKKRKVLNESDIRRICHIINGMNNFLCEPEIKFGIKSSQNERFRAETNFEKITFFLPVMEKSLEEAYLETTRTNVFDGTKEDYYNYLILSIIFHEFAHVRQKDRIFKGYNDIETKLMAICKKLMMIKGFYAGNYNVIASETDAHARGAINAYKIYSALPSEYIPEPDRIVYATQTMDTFLSEYVVCAKTEIVKSPSEILFEKASVYNLPGFGINEDTYHNLVYGKNDLTLYRKLLLGLPLTFSEASYVNMLTTCVGLGEKVDFIKKLQKRL